MEETSPLLVETGPSRRDRAGADLDGPPHNPVEWPASFKWPIVALLSFASFTVTFGCISVAPVASRITKDLDGSDEQASSAVLLVTIWELGEAAGPLFIAPLSEMFGRRPLFNAANVLFTMTTVLGALSENTATFVASRALTGMAVAANVLNPAVVADLFAPEQRGAAMSFIMFAPLIAGSLGPLFGSVVADHLGWRAVLWTTVALAALCELAFFASFRETHKLSVLRRKLARLRKQAGPIASTESLRKEIDLEKDSKGLWTSIMRPAVVFFGSAVLVAISLVGSAIYSYFYTISVSMPGILEEVYMFPSARTGEAFLANGLGSLIGVGICNLSLDRIYIKLRAASNGVGLPEYRLPLTIIGSLTLPPAVALYGWSAELQLPLALFILSVVWIRVSMTLAFLPLISYVVDACGQYSASALTGIIVTRCLAGAFLPLGTTALTERLGYGWGFTMLAAFSMTVGLIPVLLLRYGARWRQCSKYTITALER